MLGTEALGALVRDTHDVATLSVYIDGRVTDHALRTRWRTELQHALDAVRAGVSDTDREAFLICETRLEQVLSRFDGAIGSPGYVAFVTPDQVRFAEPVATPMPTISYWSRGARVAPYVRALEHERPVIAVVAGSREARLYRWHAGTLTRLEPVQSRESDDAERVERARTSQAGNGHRNVRGTTGADDVRRVREADINRLIGDVVERIGKEAGTQGWVVIGGAKDVVPRLLSALPRQIAERTLVQPTMKTKATLPEIRESVQEGATSLRHAREQAMVSALVERAHAKSRAAVGLAATQAALEVGAVEELLLTSAAWRRNPAEVEAVVSSTLLQGGAVEEVNGEAARQLDAEADGVGALLRFVNPSGGSNGQDAAA